MTKREYFALHLMAGMLADSTRAGQFKDYARYAIEAADALISELNKETSK